ncbi:hypothetical protein JN531_017145 (plasmid) [Flagellatimonas centrodinii]|uniref:hypothetical protein n=1 Tax=Flagellatimonas centrodinii TaxID=2806210 RepID=UPI001FEFF60E|nr:hypothetical protein [Flagellatimonas centrodinii]ULQ48359.1 hypothetical protein JN531_017145 [Flagellatimonas centrodinii]
MTNDLAAATSQAFSGAAPGTLIAFEAMGYTNLRVLPDGRVVALHPFLFTVGLVVGLTATHYQHRYCYPDAASAHAAITSWDGVGHPPGPWIKRKGLDGELANEQTFQGIPVRQETAGQPRV